ncbi:hypothetical protein BDQ94DRAFT_145027 [Aspergillus welwitschiae]|uniref:Uncharacterized protein n=1 Tax=Aspergillus welwitschiae TaxID=1341132 RepID=A0A3F3Q0M3_9EURO|nr:hypothetical protein BDQ94DRAFT_145027 [Aspergillus welwitschiae]RDH32783.1 hypothetical protein BDQ94DRAFT_145027 [Aspergillus welwitschiae]
MGMWLFREQPLPSGPLNDYCLNSLLYALYIWRVHPLAMYGTPESNQCCAEHISCCLNVI